MFRNSDSVFILLDMVRFDLVICRDSHKFWENHLVLLGGGESKVKFFSRQQSPLFVISTSVTMNSRSSSTIHEASGSSWVWVQEYVKKSLFMFPSTAFQADPYKWEMELCQVDLLKARFSASEAKIVNTIETTQRLQTGHNFNDHSFSCPNIHMAVHSSTWLIFSSDHSFSCPIISMDTTQITINDFTVGLRIIYTDAFHITSNDCSISCLLFCSQAQQCFVQQSSFINWKDILVIF